ncbi:MAG: BamA/TamA family outer membrane protein [Bacteroidales bacterium]
MKKSALLFVLAMLALTLPAQESKTKSGWNFGVLPSISFDSDLGFQYGGLIDLYNYGTGDIYPDFYHKIYVEVSRYTKGSGINRLNYETIKLIPGVRYTTDLSFLTDQAYDFYGFNGYDAVIVKDWMDLESDDYITRMFYRHKRSLFRFKNDFEGKLSGPKLLWNAGFAVQKFTISSVDLDKLNKGRDLEDQYPDVPGLYELYKDWGIIDEEEADGGLVTTLKAGISYDTRDNRPNPMKGIWTEAGIETSQKFLGSEASFGKFYFTHRQYFTLIPNDLSLAYRLGYQQTIFGDVPFYYQPQVIVSALRGAFSEGLGGSKTLRGIWRNRVVGDGFFYGNVELRWKPVRFTFINQNFYIGLNGFTDFGMITKKIDFTIPNSYPAGFNQADFFDPEAEKLHITAGAGLRVVMNENFIIAFDLGKAFNEQDGGIGFYVGLNYLF